METVGLGFYWNNLEVGYTFKTVGRTVTEADITNFVNATGMVEVLFTNLEFLENRSSIKGRVAPAALAYCFAEGLLVQATMQETGLAQSGLLENLLAMLATRGTAEWLADLDAANVPAMPVNAVQDLPQDAHLKAVDFWRLIDHPSEGTLRTTEVPVGMSKSPGSIRRLAPRLGEHSEEILKEAGLREAEIEAMVTSGATLQDRE